MAFHRALLSLSLSLDLATNLAFTSVYCTTQYTEKKEDAEKYQKEKRRRASVGLAGDAEGAVNEEAKESLLLSGFLGWGVVAAALDKMARKGGRYTHTHIHLEKNGDIKHIRTHGPLILYFVKREGGTTTSNNQL
jgi:hypothetical protein